jgi:aspartate kinase
MKLLDVMPAGNVTRTAEAISRPERAMEDVLVEGVTATADEAKITLRIADVTGVQSRVFRSLAEAGLVVDVIVQVPGSDGLIHLTFTTPMSKLRLAVRLLEKNCADLCPPECVRWEDDLSKVSLVGVGMRSHAGVAQKMFQLLAREDIKIHLIATSEVRISCLIDSRSRERAVRALRDGFGLDRRRSSPDPREDDPVR